MPNSDFTSGGTCKKNKSETVNVIAQSAGSSFNKPAGSSFSVASNSISCRRQGQTISGGTDNIVQTVNQNDINNAKNKIAAANDAELKKTLSDQLKKEDYYAIASYLQRRHAGHYHQCQCR